MARVLSTLQLAALGLVVKRLLPGAHRAAPLRPLSSAADASNISVVIPARNEEWRIGQCLTALKSAAVGEVIVVDDESTDDTATLAASLGATVIAGQPLPDGWVGKPWALKQGLDAAKHDVVVLLDADTVPKPGLFDALVSQLAESDIVSLAPRFLTSSVAEQAIHASMLVELVYRFGPVGVDVSDDIDRIYGNGQCLAFRRSWLMENGGFDLVASDINDDIALLRALAARGARIKFCDGRELVDVRMYDSAADVWRQWPRSLPMNDIATTWSKFLDVAALQLVLALPVVRLLAGRSNVIDKACIAMRVAMSFAVAPSYEGSKTGVFLSPLADVATVARITQVMARPVRKWKQRTY